MTKNDIAQKTGLEPDIGRIGIVYATRDKRYKIKPGDLLIESTSGKVRRYKPKDIAPIIPANSQMARCKKRNHITRYSLKYDCTYCQTCDRFLEKKCGASIRCSMCSERPRKPSLVVPKPTNQH